MKVCTHAITSALLLALSSSLNDGSTMTASACQIPTGIGAGDVLDFATTTLPASQGDPLGVFGNAVVAGALAALSFYETPIQARIVMATVTPIYNTAASFEAAALDIYGRGTESEDRRRCPDTDATLLDQHRQVTLAYAVLWSMKHFLGPTAEDGVFDGLATSWGLDLEICSDDEVDCTDLSTPWGLASTLLEDSIDIFSRDGWNADGSLGAEFNVIPYSDWREQPYTPVTNPFSWQPLLETNKLGFLYRQEHVTPHIGFTAKSFFVGDDKVCERTLGRPGYKYKDEIDLVLQRSAALDDQQKVEIEFFDSKLTSLVPLTVQQFLRQGISLDSFDFIQFDTATIGVLYETVLQSWREKVLQNRVRPTTLIHSRKYDEIVTAYQGPAAGGTVGDILGQEFQPYIRVMPHAEYPSGSSCICKAFARAAILFQGDDVTALLGGPLVETVTAGSSRVEPGITPASDVNLIYTSWSEVAQRCGETRLEGGLHFTASVPDGETLCEDIGTDLYNYFEDLKAGIVPEFTADLAAMPTEARCTK